MLDLLRQYRRDLHQIPELDFDLPKTTRYIRDALSKYDCRILTPSPSAICAWFDFGKKETIAFRADMDGLPIAERTSKPYASRHTGKMHACGHDGHMSMILALAERIESHREALSRNVMLIFQPAEETEGGAESIVESGILTACHVVRIFGCHLWPELPAGTVGARRGAMMARGSEVEVAVKGRSAHIAKARQGSDALYAAAAFLTASYKMEREEIPAGIYRLLKFGILQSGTACNAISASAFLKGSLRAFDQETYDHIQRRMEEIAGHIERSTGCTFEINLTQGHPPLCNTPELFDLVVSRCPDQIQLLAEPSMTSEDFSYYARHCPVFFFFLGLGVDTALHTDHFDFDEAALLPGLAFYENLLLLP